MIKPLSKLTYAASDTIVSGEGKQLFTLHHQGPSQGLIELEQRDVVVITGIDWNAEKESPALQVEVTDETRDPINPISTKIIFQSTSKEIRFSEFGLVIRSAEVRSKVKLVLSGEGGEGEFPKDWTVTGYVNQGDFSIDGRNRLKEALENMEGVAG